MFDFMRGALGVQFVASVAGVASRTPDTQASDAHAKPQSCEMLSQSDLLWEREHMYMNMCDFWNQKSAAHACACACV